MHRNFQSLLMTALICISDKNLFILLAYGYVVFNKVILVQPNGCLCHSVCSYSREREPSAYLCVYFFDTHTVLVHPYLRVF